MTFVLSALAFLVLLTLLVIVHELGHFMIAKWVGVTVEEFGFGLPPRAKKLFEWGGTLFSLNWIPFGGFVRLQGEMSMDLAEREQPGSFAEASIPARLTILLAGVTMNFLLAMVLLTVGFAFWRWVPTYLTIEDLKASEERREVSIEWGLFVSEVIPGGRAERAGVASGSLLAAVNGHSVATAEDVLALQSGRSSIEYTLRTGEEFTEEKSVKVSVEGGRTGVVLSEFAVRIEGKERTFGEALTLAWRETATIMTQTVRGAGLLFTTLIREGRIPKGITGIIGIAELTHSSVQEGLMTYLRLVALLSLSLAALNVLPFPALDGGRILFVFVEILTRRPLNRRLEVATNALGFFLLILLIAAVTLNDIIRLFSPSP